MTSVKRHTHWVILRIIRPRIWTQPTQFQNLSEISKNEFPGNCTKSWISPESAWFTDSFSTFENKKIAHRKKLWRFLLPEFNLTIPRLNPGIFEQRALKNHFKWKPTRTNRNKLCRFLIPGCNLTIPYLRHWSVRFETFLSN